MEHQFRIFLTLVLIFAACALCAAGWLTFARLQDAGTRLEREDRAAFTQLTERLAVPENITGVQIQVRSTMGDYSRYDGFDKTLLGGMTFAHHEYLRGGSGTADTDLTVTVTLYKTPSGTLTHRLLGFLDRTFGTDWLAKTEKVVLHRDGDVFRVQYREASFVVVCEEMAAWIDERAEG